MEKYTGLLIWILIAIIAIIIIKKIVRKITSLIITIVILILTGSIPYTTINTVVDTAKGGYEIVSKQAALWSLETKENGDETFYLLNVIPIKIKD